MMLRHNLRTDAQICGKSATQASLFVRHGRGVNRVYRILLLSSMSFSGDLTVCTLNALGDDKP